MLVIGGGIVGLEMATVYASLGARVDVVEVLDHLMPGADRDLVSIWTTANRDRLGRIMLSTRAVSAESGPDGISLMFDGADAPSEPELYDFVLAAAGRTANGDRIGADMAGLSVARGGTIAVDPQMRTAVPHIYAIGDVAGVPMLAHKAVHEGHVAAEAAADLKSAFDAAAIPSVAYTRPEIAWAGLTEAAAAAEGRRATVSRFPWSASGRALASGAAAGMTKLLFDDESGRIVGGGIVGAHAGELIAEVVLAIEMGGGCGRPRPHDPPAPDALGDGRHGGRGRGGRVHGPAAGKATAGRLRPQGARPEPGRANPQDQVGAHAAQNASSMGEIVRDRRRRPSVGLNTQAALPPCAFAS